MQNKNTERGTLNSKKPRNSSKKRGSPKRSKYGDQDQQVPSRMLPRVSGTAFWPTPKS